ncbi:MAG TPA: polysaccharide biosynthesis/export family protein [Anaeromyxobacter sp.]|nr:polysaccharide biosynthesis/export family protein [Anaeromyxobacter sp.]
MERPTAPGHLLLPLASALAALLAGCSHPGSYVRVEDLKPSAGEGEYRISENDVLGVRVFNQESLSLDKTRVRDDGKIAVPFLGDVEAVGRTPVELGKQIQARLKTFVVNPVVTVTVEEMRPLRIPVLGEVTKPGLYDLDREAGVLAALAAAGGMTPFAHRDEIFVLRYRTPIGEPWPQRIRFDSKSLSQGDRASASFRLRVGDVVLVE